MHIESLEMKQRLFKGDHSDIVTSLNNIGLVYYDLGKNDEALKYLIIFTKIIVH